MRQTNGTSMDEIVSVSAKRLDEVDSSFLKAKVSEEIAKMEGMNITSYKVIARGMPAQHNDKYTVMVVASAMGKTFSISGNSNGEVYLADVYSNVNDKIKRQIEDRKDKWLDEKRRPYK